MIGRHQEQRFKTTEDKKREVKLYHALHRLRMHVEEYCLQDAQANTYYPESIPREVVLEWVEEILEDI